MATWTEIESQAPDLARIVRERFDATLHKTLATLRKDGSPRVSGTEVKFEAGGVWLGAMGGSRKAHDLRRDGRCALHSSPIDEKLVDGDAKLSGVAVEITDLDELHRVWPDWGAHQEGSGADAFRVDVTEVVLTKVEGDEIVIRSWNPRDGERVVRRR